MISLEARRNIISITLALNVSFTTITFTKDELGGQQCNVKSDTGMSYSTELKDYNNPESSKYLEDEIIDTNKKYIAVAIKNCFAKENKGEITKKETQNRVAKKINFL